MRTSKKEEMTVEEVWQEFWLPIVAPNGTVDIEQIKKELSDYWRFMDNCAQVYAHVTGNQISKVNTDPDVVCVYADTYYASFDEEK